MLPRTIPWVVLSTHGETWTATTAGGSGADIRRAFEVLEENVEARPVDEWVMVKRQNQGC